MTLIRSPMLSQVDRVVAARRREPATPSSTCSPRCRPRRRRAGPEPRRRAHGRARRPPRGHPARRPRAVVVRQPLELARPRAARHRHQPGLPERRGPRRRQHGRAVGAGRSRSRRRSASTLERRLGRQLGQPRLGAQRRADVGRVNDLRLGEAILLGREPLDRQPIDGLHTDAFTLVAEVIESKVEAVAARGARSPRPRSAPPPPGPDRGDRAASRSWPSATRTSTPTGLEPPPGVDDPRGQQRPPRRRRGSPASPCGLRAQLPARLQRAGPGHDLAVRHQGHQGAQRSAAAATGRRGDPLTGT